MPVTDTKKTCELCGDTYAGKDPASWGIPDVYDNKKIGLEGLIPHEHVVCMVCFESCVLMNSNGGFELTEEGEQKLAKMDRKDLAATAERGSEWHIKE